MILKKHFPQLNQSFTKKILQNIRGCKPTILHDQPGRVLKTKGCPFHSEKLQREIPTRTSVLFFAPSTLCPCDSASPITRSFPYLLHHSKRDKIKDLKDRPTEVTVLLIIFLALPMTQDRWDHRPFLL